MRVRVCSGRDSRAARNCSARANAVSVACPVRAACRDAATAGEPGSANAMATTAWKTPRRHADEEKGRGGIRIDMLRMSSDLKPEARSVDAAFSSKPATLLPSDQQHL